MVKMYIIYRGKRFAFTFRGIEQSLVEEIIKYDVEDFRVFTISPDMNREEITTHIRNIINEQNLQK